MENERDEVGRDRPQDQPGAEPTLSSGPPSSGPPGDAPAGDGPDGWARPGDPLSDDALVDALKEGSPDGPHTALPPKIEAWRRRSAVGAILTGFALGLQEALETRKEEPSIVLETSGEPPRDLPVEADFEYGRPRQSVVHIRPWLLPDGEPEPGDGQPNAADEDGPKGS